MFSAVTEWDSPPAWASMRVEIGTRRNLRRSWTDKELPLVKFGPTVAAAGC
jgi:hypothetical protein